jgi:hypothetical protein
MRTRFRTRWAVAVFIAIGLLVALVLLVRDLDDSGVPQQDGTAPALVG